MAISTILKYVTDVLLCFWVCIFIWLAKALAVNAMASCFYRIKCFDRIQKSLFNQFLIQTLSGPPQEFDEEEQQRKLVDEVQKRRLIGGKPDYENDGITIDDLKKLNQRNVSGWNMKRLMNMILDHEPTILEITIEDEAKAAAQKIFQNVARPGSSFIYQKDLMRFMGEDEAEKTMDLFEGASSESEMISKSALENFVVKASAKLALRLSGAKAAVKKLDLLLNFIVGIIINIILLNYTGGLTSEACLPLVKLISIGLNKHFSFKVLTNN